MRLDVGLAQVAPQTLPVYARRAEALGYGCLWASETKHDPFLPLAVAASVTTRLGLGTAIAVAFARSPMVVAQIAWDLQQASGGRFVLGLGTQVKGHNERRFSVPWGAPGPRLREYVGALRAIWECWQRRTPLAFRGAHYRFDLMTPFFDPGPIEHPSIPVWTAAVNPGMCRLAGEIADGLHVHSFHSPMYLRTVVRPAVEEGLRRAGRVPARFPYRAAAMVILGDTDEDRARRTAAVRQQIAFYASTRTYEPVLAVHGWADLVPHLHRKSLAGDWQGMAALITDEMLEQFAVPATWETVATKLRARYEGLCDFVEFYPACQPPLDDPRLAALVREVNGSP